MLRPFFLQSRNNTKNTQRYMFAFFPPDIMIHIQIGCAFANCEGIFQTGTYTVSLSPYRKPSMFHDG